MRYYGLNKFCQWSAVCYSLWQRFSNCYLPASQAGGAVFVPAGFLPGVSWHAV